MWAFLGDSLSSTNTQNSFVDRWSKIVSCWETGKKCHVTNQSKYLIYQLCRVENGRWFSEPLKRSDPANLSGWHKEKRKLSSTLACELDGLKTMNNFKTLVKWTISEWCKRMQFETQMNELIEGHGWWLVVSFISIDIDDDNDNNDRWRWRVRAEQTESERGERLFSLEYNIILSANNNNIWRFIISYDLVLRLSEMKESDQVGELIKKREKILVEKTVGKNGEIEQTNKVRLTQLSKLWPFMISKKKIYNRPGDQKGKKSRNHIQMNFRE